MQKMIITKKQPVKKRPPAQKSEAQIQQEEFRAFKRNRWIFLACTLVVCVIVVAVLAIREKQESDIEIAEYNDPQKFEEAKLLHDALFLKYDLHYSIKAFVIEYAFNISIINIPGEQIPEEQIAVCEKLFKLHEDYVAAAKKYNQLARTLGKKTLERDLYYSQDRSKLDAIKEKIRHCNISDVIKRYESFYDKTR